ADAYERHRDVRLRAGSDVYCRGVQAAVFTHGDAHRGKPGVEQVDVVVGEACRGLVEPVDEAGARRQGGARSPDLVEGVLELHTLRSQDRRTGGHLDLHRASDYAEGERDVGRATRLDDRDHRSPTLHRDRHRRGRGARVKQVDVVVEEARGGLVEPVDVVDQGGRACGLRPDLVEGLVVLDTLRGQDELVGVDRYRASGRDLRE